MLSLLLRAATLLAIASGLACADDPAWWTHETYGIFDSVGGPLDHSAPINVGQLKHVASQAKAYLDAEFGFTMADWDAAYGGQEANPFRTIAFQNGHPDSLIDSLAPANVGQLKAVAVGFYTIFDQHVPSFDVAQYLEDHGLSSSEMTLAPVVLPWAEAPLSENYAPANVGQLKMVFSFEIISFDTDGDGMPDAWEIQYGLNPSAYNHESSDSDSDGVTDISEFQLGLHPMDSDTDDDLIHDGDELVFGTEPAVFDTDGDGLGDGLELNTVASFVSSPLEFLNPLLSDSDSDGVPDGDESADGDSLTNFEEALIGSDPNARDTDQDGFSDSAEVASGLDPTTSDVPQVDSDSDGLPDLYEQLFGTNPISSDTNSNGMPDGEEFRRGGDPANAAAVPSDSTPLQPTYVPQDRYERPHNVHYEIISESSGIESWTLSVFRGFEDDDSMYRTITYSTTCRGSCPPHFSSRQKTGSIGDPWTDEVSWTGDVGSVGGGAVVSNTRRYSEDDRSWREHTGYDSEGRATYTTRHYTIVETTTLSNRYTRGDAEARFNELVNTLPLEPGGYSARRYLNIDGRQGRAITSRFRLKWPSDMDASLRYPVTGYIVFFPYEQGTARKLDGAAEVIGEINWSGLSDESPEYSLNPNELRPGEDGDYQVIFPEMVVDRNRDGRMDGLDMVDRHLPFRFWINDDDDSGDVVREYRDDLPGSISPDYANGFVDGRRDLVDFFGVHLPYSILGFDSEEYSVVLKQTVSSCNVVFLDLLSDEYGALQGGGDFYTEKVHSAQTHQLTPSGVEIPEDFLAWHFDERGYVLFEGRASSSSPIILEVRSRSSGRSVLAVELDVVIRPVDEMMRIVNLRESDPRFEGAGLGPWTTDLGMPPNYPDGYYNLDKSTVRTVIHVHGFNWGSEEVPSAHAEVFKRLFQAGSNARFIGVTWYGDQGTYAVHNSSIDYNENVINAFVTAGAFADELSGFSGPNTYIFAHSLGNVVASSAIMDFGFEAGMYFMVNAAIPVEAIDGERPNRRIMVPDNWLGESGTDYEERLLSPNWHRLFVQGHIAQSRSGENQFTINSGDRRADLRWKGRFNRFPDGTEFVNYYSTGEEVLARNPGGLPAFPWPWSGYVWNKRMVWVYNEMTKGTVLASSTGDRHGGWGFNSQYDDAVVIPSYIPFVPPVVSFRRTNADSARAIPNGVLITQPFFRRFTEQDNDFHSWGNGSWLYSSTTIANARLPILPSGQGSTFAFQNHAKILAEAIPAHSDALGAVASDEISQAFGSLNNVDLDSEATIGEWPISRLSSDMPGWRHSDYKDPAFCYVYFLYTDMVTRGGLDR